MDYFRLNCAYLFKNGKGKQFFVFACLVLIPCAIIAYYYPISRIIGWLYNYNSFGFDSWSKLWVSNISLSLRGGILCAFAFIMFVLAQAIISTMISRHLRVGSFSVKGIFFGINENFFPALFATLGFVFLLLFSYTIISLFVFMWFFVNIKALGLILTVATIIILVIIFIYSWATTNLWLPVMSFNGLNAFKSFSVAFYKSRISQKKFFVPYLVLVALIIGFGFASYYTRMIPALSCILTTVSYIFASVFIISFSFISYFKVEEIPREDLAYLYKSK